MSILTDNAITRLISGAIDKLKLGALLLDDIFKYFFTASSFGELRKYLYITGIAYMALRSTCALGQWWNHWSWTFKERNFATQFNQDEFKMRYGQGCWVVVTGFAAGIGLSFAQQFARFGYNLVLVDCQKERSAVSERWVRQYNKDIKTKVIILDLTQEEQVIRDVLKKETEGLDIGILVNNAGMSAGGEYVDIETKKIIDCYRLNVLTGVYLTKLFLPHMQSRPQRSAIINIGSGIGQLSSPVTGIYPATKQFIRIFSRTLDLE